MRTDPAVDLRDVRRHIHGVIGANDAAFQRGHQRHQFDDRAWKHRRIENVGARFAAIARVVERTDEKRPRALWRAEANVPRGADACTTARAQAAIAALTALRPVIVSSYSLAGTGTKSPCRPRCCSRRSALRLCECSSRPAPRWSGPRHQSSSSACRNG